MTLGSPIAQIDRLIAKGVPTTSDFQRTVLSYFKKHGRDLPWRRTRSPYKILVSEVMLQQTQVERVRERYGEFLHAFPSWRALSEATPREVVSAWMGLGYYRRALNLHRAARDVCCAHKGRAPRSVEGLQRLPGIGPYTAAAVAAFAYGEPAPMIETNIRTVFLYVYFSNRTRVSDREVMMKVRETLYEKDPRAWFYALMDLGAEIKRHVKGINKRSRHHAKQSRFEGSQRQARARILRLLTRLKSASKADLVRKVSGGAGQAERALLSLERDGLVQRDGRGRFVVGS
jgi:A/G-specific adenine glycosylase